MKTKRIHFTTGLLSLLLLASCDPDGPGPVGTLQLVRIMTENQTLSLTGSPAGIPVSASLTVEFTGALDHASAQDEISLTDKDGNTVSVVHSFTQANTRVTLDPVQDLSYLTEYSLVITKDLKGPAGETFPGFTLSFTTEPGKLRIETINLNGKNFAVGSKLINVSRDEIRIDIAFTDPLPANGFESYFNFSHQVNSSKILSPDRKGVTVTTQSALDGYTRYSFSVSSNLVSADGYTFEGFTNSFFTELDSTYKFPEIPDEELLEKIQRETFRYFWDFGHPTCGLARERNTSGDVVTTGGSGFGLMGLVAAMEREFIARDQGIERIDQVVSFLEICDRFHGAWPHWLNGRTGKTIPFSSRDNGGDLVETAFLIQGLLTVRNYLNPDSDLEKQLIDRITTLYEEVEWTWYQNGRDVLYWHWSPNFNFEMNHQIRGYNETMIVYVLAASSPTYSIPASAYHNGYAAGGAIRNGKSFYGIRLPLGWDYGGPLFFTHYSFLGLDPRGLSDRYADYWEQCVNQSLINWSYCKANPKGFTDYSEDCWGLTASDNPWGYNAHSPTNDLGVITPTAAISSLPYVPEQSMRAIRHFYYRLGDKLWGPHGFYDAFSVTNGWWGDSYLAIDQGPILVMIENHRTGLLWDLFMKSPEIKQGLEKLGFTF